jgi:phospholipid/cholesterol/gamma-HCH transport system substrate-binding protein
MFNSKYAIIVGFFVSIGMLILIVLVFTLGGQHHTFERKIDIIVLFDDIGGLKPGDNVWLLGVKVGVIQSVRIVANNKVIVDLSVEKSVQKFIHKNAKVKIGSDGLMGNRIVVIYDGSSNSDFVQSYDSLSGDKSINTQEMLSTLSESNKNVLAITANIKVITENVLKGQGLLSKLINDSIISKNVQLSVADIRASMSHVKLSAQNSQQIIENIAQYTDKLNKDGGLANELVSDTIIFQNIKESSKTLRHSLEQIQAILSDLKNTTSTFDNENTTPGIILHDNNTAAHLKSILKNVDTASQRLSEDLEAIQHNFLFRGYFRKKKK